MPDRNFLEKKTENHIRKRNEVKLEFRSDRILQKSLSEIIIQTLVTENHIVRDIDSNEMSQNPKITHNELPISRNSNYQSSHTQDNLSGNSRENVCDAFLSSNRCMHKANIRLSEKTLPKYKNLKHLQNGADELGLEENSHNIIKKDHEKGDTRQHNIYDVGDARFQCKNLDNQKLSRKFINTDDVNKNNKSKADLNDADKCQNHGNCHSIIKLESQNTADSNNVNYHSKNFSNLDKMLSIRNNYTLKNPTNSTTDDAFSKIDEIIPLHTFQPIRMCSTDYVRMSVRELIKYFENWKLFGEAENKVFKNINTASKTSSSFSYFKLPKFNGVGQKAASSKSALNVSANFKVPLENSRKRRRTFQEEDKDVEQMLNEIIKNKNSTKTHKHHAWNEENNLNGNLFDYSDEDENNFLDCWQSFEVADGDKPLKINNGKDDDSVKNEGTKEAISPMKPNTNRSYNETTKNQRTNSALDTHQENSIDQSSKGNSGKYNIITRNTKQAKGHRNGNLIKNVSSMLIFLLFLGGIYALLKRN